VIAVYSFYVATVRIVLMLASGLRFRIPAAVLVVDVITKRTLYIGTVIVVDMGTDAALRCCR
jgi:hypothetical protein